MSDKQRIPVNFPNATDGKFGIRPSETDPFGSYTGVPKEVTERPVQDADDL